MDARVITMGEATELEAVADRVAAALQSGGVVVLPTDTVYGLAALADQADAVGRVFDLKGRSHNTPLAVLCADVEQALGLVASELSDVVRVVGERWWPGPLTLVAPRRPKLDLHLGEPTTTIGVRVPNDLLVQLVARRVGPIAATSANRHGLPTPTDAMAAAASLTGEVTLVIDGGDRSIGASTVIDVTTRPWTALRTGPIDPAAVVEIADAIQRRDR